MGDDISFKKCSAISDMFYQRWCLEDNLLNQHNAKHLKKPEEELMYAVWHPARYWYFFLSQDENKKIDPIFTEKVVGQ